MSERWKRFAAVTGGFFRDAEGNFSYARLASAFCLLFSVVAFFVGIHWKELVEHCYKFIQTMTTTALGLYGSSKVQQAVGSFSPNQPPKPPFPSPSCCVGVEMTMEMIAAVGIGILTILQGIVVYIYSNSRQRMRDDSMNHGTEHAKIDDRCLRHTNLMNQFSERISKLEADMAQVHDKTASNNEMYQRLSMRLEDIARNMVTKEDLWLFKELLSVEDAVQMTMQTKLIGLGASLVLLAGGAFGVSMQLNKQDKLSKRN
ncbi:MAG: hypothetical protein MZW92_31380 [Comamonadaceae bacterium]|nr:hypothetical protein [Comamonadaceae bacterium]